MVNSTLESVAQALEFIDPNLPRDEWVTVLMGIKSEFGEQAYDIADKWSKGGASYKEKDFKAAWKSVKGKSKGITIATVFKLASETGYKPEQSKLTSAEKKLQATQRKQRQQELAAQAEQEEAERQQWHKKIAEFSNLLLFQYTIKVKSNKYLADKKVSGFNVFSFKQSLVLVFHPHFKTEVVQGGEAIKQFFAHLNQEDRDYSFLHIKRGYLAVPLMDANKQVWNIQVITHTGAKLFLKHGRKSGCFYFVGDPQKSEVIAEAEGYATAASIHMATGWFCLIAFDAGNLPAVAQAFRPLFPEKPFIVCADDDSGTKGNPGLSKAEEAARLVQGVVAVPDFSATVERVA